MNITFKNLFLISIVLLFIIGLSVVIGSQTLISNYEETSRKKFVEQIFASVEAGPLALSRLHASEIAQTHLGRLASEMNQHNEILLKIDIRTKGTQGFNYATWTSDRKVIPNCINSQSKEYNFDDAISTYIIDIQTDNCLTTPDIRNIFRVIQITLITITALIFICFFLLMFPIIFSLRSASHLIQDSTHIHNMNKLIPFVPVRKLVQLAMKAKILERDSAKMEIAKQVAHDLKSPLVALKTVFGLADSKHNKLGLDAITRIEKITQDLEPPKAITAPTPYDLSECIKMNLDLKRIEFPNIIFTENIESNIFFDRLDPNVISRSVSNIINNSIEAEAKEIKVSCFKSDGKKMITFQDNGKGISKELIQKVGQKGFSHGKKNGQGLGISFLKQKIESINGTLVIESEESSGTTITLIFS